MLIDRYTKVVLTVIAVALSLIALNPWLKPEVTTAASSVIDVNIAKVGGYSVTGGNWGDGIPVHIKK